MVFNVEIVMSKMSRAEIAKLLADAEERRKANALKFHAGTVIRPPKDENRDNRRRRED